MITVVVLFPIDNDVDIKTLPLLTESMIKELIPSIGHRARFKSNLDEWRNILNGITLSPTVMESNNYLIPQEEIPSNQEQQILHEEPLCINSDIENISGASSEISIGGDLLRFLNKTNEGKHLLTAYQSTGLLDNTARRRLCSLIINNELSNDVHVRVTSTRLHHLAHEITTIFKKEHAATYFIPYISYGPGLKRAAKGKLLDCLNNKRREYRKFGIINSSRRSSTSSTGSATTVTLLPQGLVKYIEGEQPNLSVEENLQWLRNSTEP
ncbi:hypothetical protein FQR65_LT16833 [Abscondita terminalis]|nr:hypothetical protein FQR65_LT16833 [Abscondita terminalis]